MVVRPALTFARSRLRFLNSMKNLKKTFLFLALAGLLATGGARAWGFLGHKVINQVAVYSLPAAMQPFYYRHLAELVRLGEFADFLTQPGDADRYTARSVTRAVGLLDDPLQLAERHLP